MASWSKLESEEEYKENKEGNLLAMASNLVAMASNRVAMASNLVAMAFNLLAMASYSKAFPLGFITISQRPAMASS